MPTATELLAEIIRKETTAPVLARRIVAASLVDQTAGQALQTAQETAVAIEGAELPKDDGIPPAAPTGVTLEPFIGALSVKWNPAPREDYVLKAQVEITPEGGSAAVSDATGLAGHVAHNLPYINHTVRVRFVDRWGRVSQWSAPVTGKPKESAEYLINLQKAQQLNNLQGLIPAINTSLNAGEEFAPATIRTTSLAASMSPNMLTLIEVDFESWDAGIAWPPTPAQGNGYTSGGNSYPIFTADIPAGHSASVATLAGKKWLRHDRTTSTAPGIRPFANWDRRGTFVGREYIFSAHVRGGAGLQVRLDVLGAQDSTGTGAGLVAQGNTYTLQGKPEGERVWIKFTVPSDRQFLSFRHCLLTDNSSVYWRNMKLEWGEGKTEPGPWDAGAFATGTITSRMISTLDLNATNAIFTDASIHGAKIVNATIDTAQIADAAITTAKIADAAITNAKIANAAITNAKIADAAITSAKIQSLSVDKLTAGTFTAGAITLAGSGELVAGATRISASGIVLPTEQGFTAPAEAVERKITNGARFSSIYFYNLASDGHRGTVIRSDGNGAGVRGNVLLEGRNPPHGFAYLGVGSQTSDGTPAAVYLGPRLIVEGRLDVEGGLTPHFSGTVPNLRPDEVASARHGLGTSNIRVECYVSPNNGQWYHVTNHDTRAVCRWDDTYIRVFNQSNTNQDFRVFAWRV